MLRTPGAIRRLTVAVLVDGVKEVMELTPPEIVSDVMRNGIYITGGGALIRNLDKLISKELKVPVMIGKDPLFAVARGAAHILEDLDVYEHVLMNEDDELPLR